MAMIQVGDKAFGNGAFEPIPTGTRLKVSVFEFEQTTVQNGDNKGKPQLVVTFKVTEEGAYKGRELRYNNIPLYGDGKNAFVLVTFAEAVGWKTEKGSGVDVPDDFSSLLGTELSVKVGQRASTKTNPETGQPYINNTAGNYAKLKAGAPVENDAAKPKMTWGNV